MASWTKEELAAFAQAATLQNKPFNADQASFEENNPVWEVVVIYIRGAKGTKKTQWYLAGTQNGG